MNKYKIEVEGLKSIKCNKEQLIELHNKITSILQEELEEKHNIKEKEKN